MEKHWYRTSSYWGYNAYSICCKSAKRHKVRPGITGWAQVNGWRGPTETDKQKNERVAHDLWYIANWSFWLDVKIVFLTLFGSHHKKAF